MAYLEISGVSKSFRRAAGGTSAASGKLAVLRDINLTIDKNEFVCIVGRSGSGKTTLISLIAGLIEPDRGEILLEGKRIDGPGPDRAEAEKRRRAEHYIDLVNLSAAMKKVPRELSGGMRQRVAVARGLAMDPKVLLMDEPFSALDALTRGTLQEELARIWMETRKTVVMITNDIDEAILLADSIYTLTSGPGATLGPAVRVETPHPRSRAQLIDEPSYQRVRRETVNVLMSARGAMAATAE